MSASVTARRNQTSQLGGMLSSIRRFGVEFKRRLWRGVDACALEVKLISWKAAALGGANTT
jgi:hypothetical protein